jgi:hypothetical protein
MILYKLTIEQKDLLVGQLFAPASYFNPVQDINGDWFITGQEVSGCVNPDFQWVNTLPSMEYTPPPIPENRQQKVDVITSYMKSELTDSQFRQFISDSRNYLLDYTYYSESLYYWLETTNSAEWGDYTTNGFKTKTIYRGDLVDGVYPRAEYILSILNPTI